MPQIRAEQIANQTIMDLQIAVNAAIQQSKIKDWQSDPTGWISKGVVKVVQVEPNWEDGLHLEREGQLYYVDPSDELHLAISQPPYHIILSGSTIQHNWDAETTVKMGDEAEDYSGGQGTEFQTIQHEFTTDGSDLYVYLNGSLQRLGPGHDYTILNDRTIKFNSFLEGDDTVTMIVVFSPLVASYATKAWVINRYEVDVVDVGASRVRVNSTTNITSENVQDALEELQQDILDIVAGEYEINYSLDDAYQDGSVIDVNSTNVMWKLDNKSFTIGNSDGSEILLDVTEGLESMINVGVSILPTNSTVELGSTTSVFNAIYAKTGYFDAETLYLGATAQLKFNGTRFQFTNNGTTFLNAVGTAPGEDIILEGRVLPDNQNQRDFGSSSAAWKDVYVGTSINFVPVGDVGDIARIYRNVSGSNTEMRFQIGQGASDKIIFEDENQLAILTLDGDRNVEIHGNLTVSGNTTTITSTVSQVSDSSFVISHSTPAANGDASYEVERAVLNSKLIWNDSIDLWQVDNGDGTARDLFFNGYGDYLYSDRTNKRFGVGASPTKTLDIVTAADTTLSVRTTAANNQTSTLSVRGSRTATGEDISVISLEDNSGAYDPLAKLTLRKQQTSTQQGQLLIQTNKGDGTYSTITIDKDSGITLNGSGKFTPNSSTALGGTTPLSYNGHFYAEKVYNAVWNDLADFFEVENELDTIEYGKVYVVDEEGNAKVSEEYMEEGIIGIASDTYGYGLGKKNIKNEIPIGVAGIVLAYVDKAYRTGTPLTCGPEGILTEILIGDKISYPERIVATFYRKENKEQLVSGETVVDVNNRCWVKIK